MGVRNENKGLFSFWNEFKKVHNDPFMSRHGLKIDNLGPKSRNCKKRPRILYTLLGTRSVKFQNTCNFSKYI